MTSLRAQGEKMENLEQTICPYCNAELDKGVRKCKHCGEWINQNSEDFPSELNHFNWGAFLMNWIWGIMHGKYITLLYFAACLIPIIGPIAISIWFGIAGNKWAWHSKDWQSIARFNEVQKNWVKLWIILFILGLIFAIKVFLFFVYVSAMKF